MFAQRAAKRFEMQQRSVSRLPASAALSPCVCSIRLGSGRELTGRRKRTSALHTTRAARHCRPNWAMCAIGQRIRTSSRTSSLYGFTVGSFGFIHSLAATVAMPDLWRMSSCGGWAGRRSHGVVRILSGLVTSGGATSMRF
jgi:hypothetical protein